MPYFFRKKSKKCMLIYNSNNRILLLKYDITSYTS